MLDELKKIRIYLLTGVSYAIPFIATGGILIAVSIALAPMKPGLGPDWDSAHWIVRTMRDIGSASFSFMVPIIAGYISYGIAGKPGLVPGIVGGFLCDHIPDGSGGTLKAGFLGAIIVGLLAGWLVKWIVTWPVPKFLKPIMPILVIPILSSLVIGFLVLCVIGQPIAQVFVSLSHWLGTMTTGNSIVLAMILGAMIAFDMGGPVNKAAFTLGASLIGSTPPNYAIMGACAAAICTPPLGLGLATLLHRKLWSEEEKEAGKAALAMGLIGITEGAIPFAVGDPLRVIPSIMVGSMTASVIAMLGKVGDHAPHGGPIVIPVTDNWPIYIVAIIVGVIITALLINTWKMLGQKQTAGGPPSPAATSSTSTPKRRVRKIKRSKA